MGRIAALLVAVALAALWVSGGVRGQPAVGRDERIVRAELTALAGPPPTPTAMPAPTEGAR